jgi:hypothetical protein
MEGEGDVDERSKIAFFILAAHSSHFRVSPQFHLK